MSGTGFARDRMRRDVPRPTKNKISPGRAGGESMRFRLGQSHFLRTIIPAETAVHSTAMPMTAQKP